MTLTGAAALSSGPLPRNVFPVKLRSPADHAAIARLKQQFPGAVLPAVPPPEIRNLQGVSGLAVALALLLTLLAIGTVAHTLVTSVRRRRRELAILKTIGFVTRQVRATVAWQATAIAGASVAVAVAVAARDVVVEIEQACAADGEADREGDRKGGGTHDGTESTTTHRAPGWVQGKSSTSPQG